MGIGKCYKSSFLTQKAVVRHLPAGFIPFLQGERTARAHPEASTYPLQVLDLNTCTHDMNTFTCPALNNLTQRDFLLRRTRTDHRAKV